MGVGAEDIFEVFDVAFTRNFYIYEMLTYHFPL